MGKFYKDSLKGLLTRRLLITVLAMIALLSTATGFIFVFYLKYRFIEKTTVWFSGLGNINGSFKL